MFRLAAVWLVASAMANAAALAPGGAPALDPAFESTVALLGAILHDPLARDRLLDREHAFILIRRHVPRGFRWMETQQISAEVVLLLNYRAQLRNGVPPRPEPWPSMVETVDLSRLLIAPPESFSRWPPASEPRPSPVPEPAAWGGVLVAGAAMLSSRRARRG